MQANQTMSPVVVQHLAVDGLVPAWHIRSWVETASRQKGLAERRQEIRRIQVGVPLEHLHRSMSSNAATSSGRSRFSNKRLGASCRRACQRRSGNPLSPFTTRFQTSTAALHDVPKTGQQAEIDARSGCAWCATSPRRCVQVDPANGRPMCRYRARTRLPLPAPCCFVSKVR